MYIENEKQIALKNELKLKNKRYFIEHFIEVKDKLEELQDCLYRYEREGEDFEDGVIAGIEISKYLQKYKHLLVDQELEYDFTEDAYDQMIKDIYRYMMPNQFKRKVLMRLGSIIDRKVPLSRETFGRQADYITEDEKELIVKCYLEVRPFFKN